MNIVKLVMPNKQELLKSYIKQFKCGGIFVKGNFEYNVGDDVFLIIHLQESGESIATNGTVGWQSPKSAVGYPSGIGIQFNNDKAGIEARNKIELMLGGAIQGQTNAYTF